MSGSLEGEGRLELPPEQMRELGYRVVDMLVDFSARLPDMPVLQYADRDAMEEALRTPLPSSGSDPRAVLDVAVRQVLAHAAHHAHPRFFAFVSNPSNFVSVLAETLVSGFNPFNGAWLVASGPAEIELVTVDWLRQICGMPEGTSGLFVSGGSSANLTALAVARQVKLGDDIELGVAYCSEQTHASIQRALGILGIRQQNVSVLKSDEQRRLQVDTVRHAIERDRAAGLHPFCVVASAGTTNTGAVDPLDDLAALCAEEDLWLHVDGAYGAPAVLTPEGKALMRGLELADSISLDPHKWLFQPYEIGCVLVRQGHLLFDTFAMHPEYLQDVDGKTGEVNFRDYGMQLTRRFQALKLWMSLMVFGVDAFRDAIAWGIHLAEVAEEAVRRLPRWEVTSPAQLGIVTFQYCAEPATKERADAVHESIVTGMMQEGFALVTSTTLRGRKVLRLCTINPRTSEGDILETIRHLDRLANRA